MSNKQKNQLAGLPNDLIITHIEPLEHYKEVYVEARAPDDPQCPNCGSYGCYRHGSNGKFTFRHVRDGSGKSMVIVVKRFRYYCDICDHTFTYRFNWVHPHLSITKKLYEQISLELRDTDSIRKIAKNCGTTEDIVRGVLNCIDIDHPSTLPETLCIDEFKGESGYWNEDLQRHSKTKYHCAIVDWDRKCVIDILRSRREESLRKYFMNEYSEKERERVKYLCCDMHAGFANLAKDVFPNATVCIDPFHVIKRLNQAINEVRIRYYKPLKKLYDSNSKDPVIKRRYNLLNGSAKLLTAWEENIPVYWKKSAPNAIRRLKAIFEYFPDLEEVYDAVQDYHNTVVLADEAIHSAALSDWISRYRSSEVSELRAAAKTILDWKQFIINSLTYHKSNGVCEGINNRIKVLKRNCYGFKNFELFRKRIMLIFDGTGISKSRRQPSLVKDRRESTKNKSSKKGKSDYEI